MFDIFMKSLLILILGFFVAGCPVTQPQDTPVSAIGIEEPLTNCHYMLYVPSYYSDDSNWPLVVTLHGTYGWDSSSAQIKEWKHLAEQKGFIVAAPDLKSVQGILPVNRTLWFHDLAEDEKAVLAILDHLSGQYKIDSQAILLTGFSAGGYPMYYTGLRNPNRFSMLVARGCNSSKDLFERIELTDEARKCPVMIFWGKDDLQEVHRQSWQAVRWLGENGHGSLHYKKIRGGHLRRPEVAYSYWQKYQPKRPGG